MDEEDERMGLLQSIVDGFIVTMGITPPTPEKKRAATIYIACGLAGAAVLILVFFGLLLSRIF